jgi:hypothetical protein
VVVLGEPTSRNRDAIIQPLEAGSLEFSPGERRSPSGVVAFMLMGNTQAKACTLNYYEPTLLDRLNGAP